MAQQSAADPPAPPAGPDLADLKVTQVLRGLVSTGTTSRSARWVRPLQVGVRRARPALLAAGAGPGTDPGKRLFPPMSRLRRRFTGVSTGTASRSVRKPGPAAPDPPAAVTPTIRT